MRLVAASLTSALFYVSVKSLSIGPLPCTTPEGCSPEAPRCIKCPDAGENTPGYCSFLDPRWQTDLCFNPGYAQFCANACADRHSISGGPTPGQGLRGPIESGSQSGTTPGTAPQSAPGTVPGISPKTGSDTTPGLNPETRPGNTQQSVPVSVPDTPPGTPEQQGIPSEQQDTTVPDQARPGGLSPPNGLGTSGRRRRPKPELTPGSGGPTPESGGLAPGSGGPIPESGGLTPGSGGPTPESGGLTPGSGGPIPESGGLTPGSGGPTPESGGLTPGSGGPTPGSGQVISPEEGSTLEVWPTEKKDKNLQLPDPSKTPSSGGSPSGQTLQIPTIPKVDSPVPEPKFYNQQPNSEIAPAAGQANPISTPNNLSDEPSSYTPPKIAFATFGDQEGGASQDMSAFPYFDTSTT